MNSSNDGIPTELYLVRIWKRTLVDGTHGLHGKLQQVVSGEACYFEELSSLPAALEMMMDREEALEGPNAERQPSYRTDDKPSVR